MARVFKQKVTVKLPAGSTVVEKNGRKIAQWKGKDGLMRKAPVNASGRAVIETGTYMCEFTNAEGIVRSVSTGCHDKDGAQARLAELLKREERKRAGILSPDEERAADAAGTPLTKHIDAYARWLERTGKSEEHISTTRSHLLWLAETNRWQRLSDMTRSGLEQSMASKTASGRSARTANHYRASALSFANWCVRERLLTSNPFIGVSALNERLDPRRKRRRLTPDQIVALLEAAERRPLAERMGASKKGGGAKLSPLTIERFRRVGRMRRLIYLVLVTTGLRYGELRKVQVADLALDSSPPVLHVRAGIAKGKQDAILPLREEVAAELRAWLADSWTWAREGFSPKGVGKRLGQVRDLAPEEFALCHAGEDDQGLCQGPRIRWDSEAGRQG